MITEKVWRELKTGDVLVDRAREGWLVEGISAAREVCVTPPAGYFPDTDLRLVTVPGADGSLEIRCAGSLASIPALEGDEVHVIPC